MPDNKILTVSPSVKWIGVLDHDIVSFDVVMETKYGTTYNSYFINAQKKAVVDRFDHLGPKCALGVSKAHSGARRRPHQYLRRGICNEANLLIWELKINLRYASCLLICTCGEPINFFRQDGQTVGLFYTCGLRNAD